MRVHPSLCGALAVILGSVPATQAQVFVRAPFVAVDVGPGGGVYVGVLGRPIVMVPPPPPQAVTVSPAPIQPSRRTNVQPSDEVLPAPRSLSAGEGPVPTVSQFLEAFKPRAGRYRVTVIHPATGQPVDVSFHLPVGRPRQVRVNAREVGFDYGDREVSIRFLRNGRVRVLYD